MIDYDTAYTTKWHEKQELAIGLGKILEEKELLSSFSIIWGQQFSEIDRDEAVGNARERFLLSLFLFSLSPSLFSPLPSILFNSIFNFSFINNYYFLLPKRTLTTIPPLRGREEIFHLLCPELWDVSRFCKGQNPWGELFSFLLYVVRGEENPSPHHPHFFPSSPFSPLSPSPLSPPPSSTIASPLPSPPPPTFSSSSPTHSPSPPPPPPPSFCSSSPLLISSSPNHPSPFPSCSTLSEKLSRGLHYMFHHLGPESVFPGLFEGFFFFFFFFFLPIFAFPIFSALKIYTPSPTPPLRPHSF